MWHPCCNFSNVSFIILPLDITFDLMHRAGFPGFIVYKLTSWRWSLATSNWKVRRKRKLWRKRRAEFASTSSRNHIELKWFSLNENIQCPAWESKLPSYNHKSSALASGTLGLHFANAYFYSSTNKWYGYSFIRYFIDEVNCLYIWLYIWLYRQPHFAFLSQCFIALGLFKANSI